jgi:hypothetical protein
MPRLRRYRHRQAAERAAPEPGQCQGAPAGNRLGTCCPFFFLIERSRGTAVARSPLDAAVREVLAKTEDVGDRFADEARKMHYGEAQERGIRGQATPEQTEALLDEGIAVMPLPIPAALKETLQ